MANFSIFGDYFSWYEEGNASDSGGNLRGNWENCEPEGSIIAPILIILIAAVGLFANAVVIFIIVALKEYTKSVTNIYVLQLAIADSLFLFTLPFLARTFLYGEWVYGMAWCKISESIKMINYYGSIMFLTVMSVDRFLAINYAMNQRMMKFRTRKAASIISIITWIVSCFCVINVATYAETTDCLCVINFPGDDSEYDYSEGSAAIFEDVDFAQGVTHIQELLKAYSPCSYTAYATYFINWLILNFILAFIAPLCIICICYGLIIRRIIRPMAIGSKSQQSNKTRKRVTHVVTALVTVFVVCWLPYHAFNMARINNVYLEREACNAVQHFTLVMAYANSALNPFFYTFLGTNFKRRWNMAMGKASRGLRQSILSHSGEYTPGAKRSHSRRKSSGAGNKTDEFNSSFATKHTVIPPTNALIHDEKV